MKLLDKYQINTLKATERKKEIDEGLKLAKKVDALRELTAKEQANIEKFREQTLKEVKNEITDLISQRGVLDTDVKRLQEERQRLLVPLTNEWLEVSNLKEQLNDKKEEIHEKEIEFIQKTDDLVNRIKALYIEEQRIEDTRNEIDKQLAEVTEFRNKKKTVLLDIQEHQKEVYTDCETKIKELTDRELDVASRERDEKNKEDLLNNKEKELNKQSIAIRDKYETLNRTIKRLNK